MVALVPCGDADAGAAEQLAVQLAVRPRRLYFELKLLWRLGGGCVVHHEATGIEPPYAAASYPRCGNATATNLSHEP